MLKILKYIRKCYIVIGFAPFDWEFKYNKDKTNHYIWIGPLFIVLGSE